MFLFCRSFFVSLYSYSTFDFRLGSRCSAARVSAAKFVLLPVRSSFPARAFQSHGRRASKFCFAPVFCSAATPSPGRVSCFVTLMAGSRLGHDFRLVSDLSYHSFLFCSIGFRGYSICSFWWISGPIIVFCYDSSFLT
jgi:hypothetical protein